MPVSSIKSWYQIRLGALTQAYKAMNLCHRSSHTSIVRGVIVVMDNLKDRKLNNLQSLLFLWDGLSRPSHKLVEVI